MKKIMMLIVSAVVIASAGCSQITSHEAVKAMFPRAIIVPVPGRNYEWIVKDSDGSVYWFEYAGDCGKNPRPENVIVIKLFD